MITENYLDSQLKTAEEESLPKRKVVVQLKGVPLKVFQLGYDDKFTGTVSHKFELSGKATKSRHSILAQETNQIHCSAFVVPPNTLHFSYQTKGFFGKDKDDRHPDLFAADLATTQYKYLLDQGNTIDRFGANWEAEDSISDNYQSFLNYYKEQTGSEPSATDLTGGPIATEAAWQTMSGKLAKKLGFGEITSILFDPGVSLLVNFKKTEDIEIIVEDANQDTSARISL